MKITDWLLTALRRLTVSPFFVLGDAEGEDACAEDAVCYERKTG